MKLNNLQEELVKLFLRLNGYFTTGLIIHSSTHGRIDAEIDVVSVRFPNHEQEDRIVGSCDYLQIPKDTIDILIVEVKSGTAKKQFNASIRNNKEVIDKAIGWIGVFSAEERSLLIKEMEVLLKPKEVSSPEHFQTLLVDTKRGKVSVRFIVVGMDSGEPKNNQSRHVSGQLMINYIWQCLRPTQIRETCSTTYNLEMWGPSIQPIVEYFKDHSRNAPGTMEDFYKAFGF